MLKALEADIAEHGGQPISVEPTVVPAVVPAAPDAPVTTAEAATSASVSVSPVPEAPVSEDTAAISVVPPAAEPKEADDNVAHAADEGEVPAEDDATPASDATTNENVETSAMKVIPLKTD